MSLDVCWICLNTAPLTGEHKFKASDLRRQFGQDKMSKLVRGTGVDDLDDVQGVKSAKVKFKSSICANCNGSLTQDADISYSDFIKSLPSDAESVEDLYNVFQTKPFNNPNSKKFIDLFRYLGKLLGCHIVENGLEVPEELRSFVACENDLVCIYLELDLDEFSKKITKVLISTPDEIGYVGHGGLTVGCDKKNYQPKDYQSSYTIGHNRLNFWHVLSSTYLEKNYFENSNLSNFTLNALKRDKFIL